MIIYIWHYHGEEQKIHEILDSCRTQGARIYLAPDLDAFRFLNGRLKHLGKMTLFYFNPDSESKFLFDKCFSLLVILMTLPLTCIAMFIRLFDRGPVFYQQRRITVPAGNFIVSSSGPCVSMQTSNLKRF
jgi:hypothetical protein